MARILIIDDDENFSAMLSGMVERAGHDPVMAGTIREGLEKASEGSYEVVFLDIHLPDGSGLDILQNIKESPSSPEIIIITGFDDSGAAELALKNGVWDYIKKPSSIKDMQLALLRALQYRREKGHQKPPSALES